MALRDEADLSILEQRFSKKNFLSGKRGQDLLPRFIENERFVAGTVGWILNRSFRRTRWKRFKR